MPCTRHAVPTRVARLDARQSCPAQGYAVPTRAHHALHKGMHVSMHVSHTCARYAVPTRVARLDARQSCPAQGHAVPIRAQHALHKGMHVSMHVSHTCTRYAVPTRVARLDARQSCPAQGYAVPTRASHALHKGTMSCPESMPCQSRRLITLDRCGTIAGLSRSLSLLGSPGMRVCMHSSPTHSNGPIGDVHRRSVCGVPMRFGGSPKRS